MKILFQLTGLICTVICISFLNFNFLKKHQHRALFYTVAMLSADADETGEPDEDKWKFEIVYQDCTKLICDTDTTTTSVGEPPLVVTTTTIVIECHDARGEKRVCMEGRGLCLYETDCDAS